MGLSLAAGGCGTKKSPRQAAAPAAVKLVTPETGPSALQRQLAAMPPQAPVAAPDRQKRLEQAVDAFHKKNPVRRGYISVDKPLYRPGETIWFRAFDLAAPALERGEARRALAQLISPKGAAVIEKGLTTQTGALTNDFVIPAGVPGGGYTIRVTAQSGEVTEREVIVSSYQPPRIKKKLEFLRKAYGPGDEVAAALSLSRATGEALAISDITGIVRLDGVELSRLPVETDGDGNAVIRFELPSSIERGDGLLTVLVKDGGVTESIQKRVPITLDKIRLSLFPEGGDLVAGLPGRVYFEAQNPMEKPADIEGRVVDDRGELAALFRSHWNGHGRFELTPEPGRSYFVEITRPAGVSDRFAVPAARASGCSMMAVDDFAGARSDIRVAVHCSAATEVTATAVLRGRRLAASTVEVPGGARPAVIALPIDKSAGQGAVRVTLFDRRLDPLAERLIYRGRGDELDIEIEADADSYNPRDRVRLTLRAKSDGEPVKGADLALAVVDDTVLSFADDKTATLLAEVFVESEMPGQTLEEPNFLFSDDARAPAALDMVLGTKGWRRFDWKQVFPDPPPIRTAWDYTGDFLRKKIGLGRRVRGIGDKPAAGAEAPDDQIDDGLVGDDLERIARRVPPAGEAAEPEAAAEAPPPAERPGPPALEEEPPMGAEMADADIVAVEGARRVRHRFQIGRDRKVGGKYRIRIIDKDWDGKEKNAAWRYAPVREFPVPDYPEHYDGPRTDFRETVFWAPQLLTDERGVATVSFTLSDAVTSFKAIAEGAGAGRLGRGEALIESRLPVSLAVKMPLEVSRSDRVSLPVTVANDTDARHQATLRADFGDAFKRVGAALPESLELDPGQRRTFFYRLEVVGDGAEPADGKALVSVAAAGLRDQVERTIKVVPRGFPIEVSKAGTLTAGRRARHRIAVGDIVGDRMNAKLTLYPSPLSTMTEGLEAVIREPVGCFEQASSANYPNVMVLAYMEDNDAAEPELVEKAHGMLERGYKKLTGYESPSRGYEWFGGDPGHEALTAYGLMEFVDMTEVYGDVDRQMIDRTAAWLKRRRDGKGGFKRSSKALDSFGRADPEVTDAYITYALTEARQGGIKKEVARQKQMAETTDDPYVLALAANTLLNTDAKSGAARRAVKRLAAMQRKDGAFSGADHSITRSGGVALDIETTSLAALAMLAAGDDYREPVRRAIDWINENRDGFGGYGSTQSTVLALKALSAYAASARRTKASGVVTVRVNGQAAGSVSYEKGHRGTVELDLSEVLAPGDNDIEIALDSSQPIPYSLLAEYRSKVPATSDRTAVAIETELSRREVPLGESVTAKVVVRNRRSDGIPMALARVGIPGGLSFQTWQLKELVDKKLIDFYETGEREVVLYFRSMAPGAVKRINLELLASVPGRYVGPASRAYLYYTDEHKRWVEPLGVEVSR